MKKSFLLFVALFVLSYSVMAAPTTEATVAANLLTLKDGISMAMEKSPLMIAARESVVAADGKLGQAFGAVLPNLSLSGSYGNNYTQPSKMVFTIGTTETSLDYGTDEISVISSYSFTFILVFLLFCLFSNLFIVFPYNIHYDSRIFTNI